MSNLECERLPALDPPPEPALDEMAARAAQAFDAPMISEQQRWLEAPAIARSEFLADVGRELRTPLNGLMGFSRLLAESPNLVEEDRRRVQLLCGAADALGALIADLLDVSTLQAGAVRLEAQPFAVGDLISEALAMVEPQAAEKGITLAVAGKDPGVLVGDRYRLRQVLVTFLANAVKFTSRGAVIVRLASRDDGVRVGLRIEVVDQGVGIAADKLGGLFQRVSQADGSVARGLRGAGLGLAICRELVELMGGRIGVESTLGQGSTFWFAASFPRAAAPAHRDQAVRGRAQFPGRRVLVVDDVALNRELLKAFLAQHGCVAEFACDGTEAVEAATARRYDLVLMDLHMPLMDGLAAARAIRLGGFDRPIVAVTAGSGPDQVEACFAAGMDGHLPKPLSPEGLERALARAFEADDRPAPAPTPLPAEEEPAHAAFERSMGPVVTGKVVRMFQSQISDNFLVEERSALRCDAHKVAGTAGVLGFVRLGTAARQLEAACEDGGDFAPALSRLRAAAKDAEGVLRAWSERLDAAPG